MNERLLKQARRGDADAFIALCAPLEGMVYRHCLQMMKHPADAQDAAQEAMLSAYRKLHTFRGKSELATWLFRIAHNVCLDMLKKAHRRRETVSLETLRENGFEPGGGTATPEDAYVQSSRQNELQDAILTLPLREQTLLSLRFGDSLSYEEIADIMNLPLGTVKSALSRAKDSLRTLVPE